MANNFPVFPAEGYGVHIKSFLSFVDTTLLENRVIVRVPEDLQGTLSSTKDYFIDGVIDFTGTGISIVVPVGGLTLSGYSFDVSQLVCSDDNYTLFTGVSSGNLVGSNYGINVTGVNSRVYDLVSATGNEAIELKSINYIDCTSLGTIDNYRQLLEEGTGRIGGTPELTFEGAWGGARITTSIALNMGNFSSLFKAGGTLVFSGRFITDINCNLPAVGALIDFSPSNIASEESLIIKGAFVRREGVIDANDTSKYPNIDQDSRESLWGLNTGMPNTYKYIKTTITTEIETVISAINTYYVLNGVQTVEKASHFSMPVNGEYELLSGNGVYQITGSLTVEGSKDDQLDIRMTRSIDGGVTFTDQLNHVSRTVNNLAGPRDVAFIPLNFSTTLEKGDRVRLEVENKTSTGNVSVETDSFITVSSL